MTLAFRPATPDSSLRPTDQSGSTREAGDRPVLVDDGVMVEVGDPGPCLAGRRRRRTTASVGRVL